MWAGSRVCGNIVLGITRNVQWLYFQGFEGILGGKTFFFCLARIRDHCTIQLLFFIFIHLSTKAEFACNCLLNDIVLIILCGWKSICFYSVNVLKNKVLTHKVMCVIGLLITKRHCYRRHCFVSIVLQQNLEISCLFVFCFCFWNQMLQIVHGLHNYVHVCRMELLSFLKNCRKCPNGHYRVHACVTYIYVLHHAISSCNHKMFP